MTKFVLLIVLIFSLTTIIPVSAEIVSKETPSGPYLKGDSIVDPKTNTLTQLYRYQYVEREHSLSENMKNIGLVYGLSWVFYPLLQPKVFQVEDGFSKFRGNFGKVVFDKDEPIWNFFVHPISGSQLYLLYRADGYTRMGSFTMAAISSTLFELTVEILTEPASVQDLYQTPVLGTVLGMGIEKFSLSLLNSGTTLGKILGHAINPATLMPFYEGRTLIIPKYEQEDKGAMLKMEISY